MAGSSRRGLLRLIGFGAFAALVVLRPWDRWRQPEIVFEPIDGLPPFRRLSGSGTVSGGAAVDPMFVGLEAGSPPEGEAEVMAEVRQTLCARTLGEWQPGGPVPVTYFTDLRCPNCITVERHLDAILSGSAPAIQLTTREFPVFGPASEEAARAILAAGRQDRAEAMRARLRRSAPPRSVAAWLDHASALGLDPVRFRVDFESADIARQLAEDRAAARLLGVPGTPALLIGRTLVIGVQPEEFLRALIAREAEEGPPGCG
jgi:predicted DsbA family dithiol-disulfide isomerase